MVNNKRQNKGTRSWAVGTSLLLHSLLLVGMGVGTLPDSAPEPGALTVYLAMPSAVPERATVTSSIGEKKKSHETLQFPPTRQTQPKLQEVMSQLPAEIHVSEDEPLPEPVPSQAIQISDQLEIIPEPAEPVVIEEILEAAYEDIPTAENDRVESFARNPKPGTRTSAKGMLAFAADPSALGMFARDILGPDLTEAEVLSLPEPVYPVLSRKRGEEGRVIIEIEISAEGVVRRAKVQSSSSYPRLDRAALEAVKMAVFTPATQFGRLVESERKIAYRFELENR